MRAVVVTKYGSPDGLKLVDVEKPIPRNNEILVKIYATTVTYGDARLRSFSLPVRLLFGLFSFRLGKNKILGHEFSGEVEEVGRNVTQFKPGDRVFASAGFRGGAHAEYICIPEDDMVAIKPDNMTFEEAAAVPIGANTALYILQEADIQNGHKVLIYGASGSVGSYAVQLAKYWGADVTGVCSTGNLDWVKELGANRVIDYTKSDFTQINETYDVIFDTVRKLSSSQCKGLLGENGKKKEQNGKELILELKKTPVNIQEFMNKVVEKIVQRTVVEQGVEISTAEIGPRTDRSTKFQLVPSSPINTVYSISFDDIDAGLGVFLEVVIEVSGAYKLAKKTIQKALSKRIAENTVEVINEVLKD